MWKDDIVKKIVWYENENQKYQAMIHVYERVKTLDVKPTARGRDRGTRRET